MKALLTAILMLPLIASTLMAQSSPSASQTTACGQFVQKFYDSYLAKEKALSKSGRQQSASDVALREKFTPALLKALKEDETASKKSRGDIVGLDFDPFLNSQELPDHCRVGAVHSKGGHYWVDVFVVLEKKESAKPDVIPELAFENGNWIFVNFHYGNTGSNKDENLVSTLQQLKKDRTKK